MNFNIERDILENREITVTGKRQITIPKSFYDRLGIEQSLEAYLTTDGIFLKPKKMFETTMYDKDVKKIVQKAISEGFTDEKLADEIAHRLDEYNKFISSRIKQFQDDLYTPLDSDEGDVSFNGLDTFFNKENDETTETTREKTEGNS